MDAFAERLSGADAGADQGVALVDDAERERHDAVSRQAAFRVLECWRPSTQPRPCGENEVRSLDCTRVFRKSCSCSINAKQFCRILVY